MTIKAVIFDLDNCLAPASAVGKTIADPAFNAIRAANKGHLTNDYLEEALLACWQHPFDWISKTYGFSDAMTTAGWQEFTIMSVSGSMEGYADLATLANMPTENMLVTSGFRCLQQSKIDALGIADYFSAIYIDALDDDKRLGKKGLFDHILKQREFLPTEIVVIGDNPHSEITAAKELGIPAVQILRPGIEKGENADFYVVDFIEFRKLLATL